MFATRNGGLTVMIYGLHSTNSKSPQKEGSKGDERTNMFQDSDRLVCYLVRKCAFHTTNYHGSSLPLYVVHIVILY